MKADVRGGNKPNPRQFRTLEEMRDKAENKGGALTPRLDAISKEGEGGKKTQSGRIRERSIAMFIPRGLKCGNDFSKAVCQIGK